MYTCLKGTADVNVSMSIFELKHCVKYVLNWRYSVRMLENPGKMRNKITPNTDAFYGVKLLHISLKIQWGETLHIDHAINAFYCIRKICSFSNASDLLFKRT